MDKTLESIQLIYRLLLALCLALVLASISTEKSETLYSSAQSELTSLADAVSIANEARSTSSAQIFENSDLRSILLGWMKSRHFSEVKFQYTVVDPTDVAVPDYDLNPKVTVEDQVLWGDRIFDGIESPFYFCHVEPRDLLNSLDAAFGRKSVSRFDEVTLDMKQAKESAANAQPFRCVLRIRFDTEDGKLKGTELVTLEIPARLETIDSIVGGPGEIDQAARILKGHNLGDFEDVHEITVPKIRALWSEIGKRVPPNAEDYLDQKSQDEEEKRKTRIDLLGQSVSAVLSFVGGSVVLLFLLIALLVHIVHAKNISAGNETAIREFPFFGLMRLRVGATLLMSSLALFPLLACSLCLVFFFPPISQQGSWAASRIVRWVIVLAVGVVGVAAAASSRAVLVSSERKPER
jgi:hypothetical protein